MIDYRSVERVHPCDTEVFTVTEHACAEVVGDTGLVTG
jgi:hypothetical protein